MTDREIIHFWGEGSLARWRPEVVAETGLPAETRRFLTDVGLPRGIDWTMQFDTQAGQLPQLEGHPGCYVIGRDYVVPICIDKTRGGRVVAFDINGKEEFMNSNIRLFAEFLVLYQQYRLSPQDLSDTEAQKRVTETEQRMMACDPPSLGSPDCWWALIIEQMKAGFL